VRICRLKPGRVDGDLSRLMHDLAVTSRTEPPFLVVSVGEAFFGSDALGVLVAVHTQHNATGGELVLCGVNNRARGVINICSLDRLIRIFDTETDAIDHLLQRGSTTRATQHK
jgi:anti-anti-sigma factor